MDPEIELKRICEQNNGDFESIDFKVAGEIGSFIHISKYKLKMMYRNFTISILYDFGNSDIAKFQMQSISNDNSPEFKIDTIDHFTKLVLLKKRNWKVIASDHKLKQNIEILMRRFKLNDLLENTAFEIKTVGKQNKDNYTIDTVFSLKYEQHTESAESIINFHKSIIDLIIK